MMEKWRFPLTLLGFILFFQLFRIDKSVKPYSENADYNIYNQVPEQVATVIRQSCYDCHSYHTRYPWYSNVAPVSWIIEDNVKNARKAINFSTWKEYYSKQAFNYEQRCALEVYTEYMPLKSYTWFNAHPKMTKQERNMLVEWFAFNGLLIDSIAIK
jgi:hypothetical protein